MSEKRLRAKALDLLSRRDHSEHELEQKLLSRGGEQNDVARVIKDLRDIGLLDDHRFAESFLACRSGKAWGRRRYHQELQARGIDKELVEATVSREFDRDDSVQHRKLRVLVERELGKGREQQKVVASMVRRGFAFDEIRRVLDELRSEASE